MRVSHYGMPWRVVLIVAMLTLLLASSIEAFRKQKVSIKGRLVCANVSASGVRVKLIEEDSGPDPDDDLESGYTNSKGEFKLQGSTREFGDIEPFFKVYHDCNDHARPCQRRWKIGIPDKYINSKDTMDFGVLNLEVQLEEEERDCIH